MKSAATAVERDLSIVQNITLYFSPCYTISAYDVTNKVFQCS